MYPNVNIQVQGAGSSTAPPALIDATAQIGPMSRPMTGAEMDRFEARYGYKPTAVRVGIDALAVFVHRDNPIKGLNLQQIDSIFSSTYRLGGRPIRTWGQLGLTGDWANRPISLYGRNAVSGTYGVFKNIALAGGDFDGNRYQEQPGSSTVVQSITADRYGIGYSGIGYATSGVRRSSGIGGQQRAFRADPGERVGREVPAGPVPAGVREQAPREPMDRLTYEFLRFINSRQGQEIVARDGFFRCRPRWPQRR
jgi:phosphate transport system substrate-binding protein